MDIELPMTRDGFSVSTTQEPAHPVGTIEQPTDILASNLTSGELRRANPVCLGVTDTACSI
jgi:hypothetical protein